MPYQQNLICVLQSFPSIPKDLAEDLVQRFQPKEYKRGKYYLEAGEIPKLFSFVASGLFRFFYITIEGEEYTKHFSMENNFMISLSAFLEQRGSYFYIEALEDSTVLSTDFKSLRELSEHDIRLMKFMLTLVELIYLLKEKREAEFLLKDARGRYEQFLLDYPGLEKRVKQYHIATYLGVNPVSLSRIRKSK